MNNSKFSAIDIKTTEGQEQVLYMICEEIYDLLHNRRETDRIIHQAYLRCNLCSTVFRVFEILEDYHEFLISLSDYRIHRFKRVFAKKLDEFITTIEGGGTVCVCRDTEIIDRIDEETGTMEGYNLIENELFMHYRNLTVAPYFLNQATGFHYDHQRNYDIIEDNFMGILFNEDDTTMTYNKQTETPYNIRRHYRLANKNFLRLEMHTTIMDEGGSYTTATIYRDIDIVVNEIKFWREYLRQPHKTVTSAIMALSNTKLCNDCIYNVVKFL
jgi:hypothetical protein